MGKLLSLHLPPRLEMVNKILQNSTSFDAKKDEQFDDESFRTPLFTPTSNTPFESCNISPSESFQISRELDSNEYFVEYFSAVQEKKSWTKKLKMIKPSSNVRPKLKWTSYLKSLFTKSYDCSSEHSAAADQSKLSKVKQCAHGHCKSTAKNSAPFGQIKYHKDDSLVEDQRGGGHRRSFSTAFKRLSKPKTSSSFSSSISNSTSSRNVFKRSISSNSEIESPIQAAIAHCKRPQHSIQIADEVPFARFLLHQEWYMTIKKDQDIAGAKNFILCFRERVMSLSSSSPPNVLMDPDQFLIVC